MQEYEWLSVIPYGLLKFDGTVYRLPDGKRIVAVSCVIEERGVFKIFAERQNE
jgi:hypothetical protein